MKKESYLSASLELCACAALMAFGVFRIFTGYDSTECLIPFLLSYSFLLSAERRVARGAAEILLGHLEACRR